MMGVSSGCGKVKLVLVETAMVGVESERRRAQKGETKAGAIVSREPKGGVGGFILSSSIEVSECRQNIELDKL
jgi:hypothetical protein